jgi:rhamnosyltransferase
LPNEARRAIFYLLWDARGLVDDYVVYALEHLRPFAETLVVIVNGELSVVGRGRLEPVVDEIMQRDNVGFDVGGYQEALRRFGPDRLAEYDEVILTNYTWFGPVRPFEPLFARMNTLAADFWGITDHGEVTPNPFTGEGTMPAHIQSHWIAVRKRVVQSSSWASYWNDMPPVTSYSTSIMHHEARFTQFFTDAGFIPAVVYPHADYPATFNPASDSAHLLLRDGCPIFKRRALFQDPLYLDKHAIIGRWLFEGATETGYPAELIWSNIVKSTAPKVLNTTASMLEILPDVDLGYDSQHPMRIAAAVHIFYDDMTDELLDRIAWLPSAVDLYVTTPDEVRAERIRARIAERANPGITRSEVRVLPSNRGRDQSAFYVGLRDVILSDDYDLIVKIHSKKSVQEGATVGRFFKKQQIGNLLHSPGYAANIVRLFQKEPGLGLVFPPTIHIGHPTLGGAWFGNQARAAEFAAKAGIRVPLDKVSPLAPLGGMFIARPAAIRRMLFREWSFNDYPNEDDYGDGALSHVQERIVAYAAAEDGFHTRTVAHAGYIAISHTYLEYKLDLLSQPAQGYPIEMIPEVIDHVRRGHRLLRGNAGTWFREYLNLNYPWTLRGLKSVFRRRA